MTVQPLTRDAVAAVVAGRGAASRVPLTVHLWVHADQFGDREAAVRALLDRYPQDIDFPGVAMPRIYDAPAGAPGYRWMNGDRPAAPAGSVAHDNAPAILDWAQLDGILADWPDPRHPGAVPPRSASDKRYRLGHWWFCLFERHWSLRGMSNALTDYYTDPESVHRLFRALTDFYKAMIVRLRREGECDGVMTSDDIGTQTGPFFSLAIFREFFKPYYRELIETAHDNGMHFWLHSCGNIEIFLPEFIEIGLDVIHPIQKHTMDERKIAAQFGGQIAIWAGMDVQQTIPWGTPEEVRREVRFLIDTYRRREGRLLLTAGNGINGDCPVASLEAFFDEALRYGTTR